MAAMSGNGGLGCESKLETKGNVDRQRPFTLLECQLIAAVKASMQYELYANASFLCEKLYAEVANEEVRLLLAECYAGMHLLLYHHRRKQTLQGLFRPQRLHLPIKPIQARLSVSEAAEVGRGGEGAAIEAFNRGSR